MTLKEIRELMLLNDWSREDLAERLGLCRNSVARWFCSTRSRMTPSVTACLVMRQWLTEARAAAREPAGSR